MKLPNLLTIKLNNHNIQVIDDSVLLAGTKIRAMVPFMKQTLIKDKPNNIFFPASANGLGMLALSQAAHHLRTKYKYNITVNIYTQYYESSTVKLSRKFGSIVHVLDKPMREIYKILESDAKLVPNPIEISLGGDNKLFIDIFTQKLAHILNHFKVPNTPNTHFWIVYGSGTLYRALSNTLDQVVFHLVVVGKKPHLSETHDEAKVKIYYAPQPFYESPPVDLLPPFDTESTYDGKIWQFLIKEIDKYDGSTYVWNVGCLPKKRFKRYQDLIF